MTLTKLKEMLKDKWPFVISAICCVGFALYAFGCRPETKSLIHPGIKVDRSELNIEIDTLLAQYENRVADIERQEQLKKFIFEQTLVVAQGGSPNPVGILTALFAILGAGATADDVRLRRQRAKVPYYQPMKTEEA